MEPCLELARIRIRCVLRGYFEMRKLVLMGGRERVRRRTTLSTTLPFLLEQLNRARLGSEALPWTYISASTAAFSELNSRLGTVSTTKRKGHYFR